MIKYVKQRNIDLKKYDRCIENSTNSRIYAYSWYLNIVADNWDVLILGDYEAVMPLPWRSKYLIKYIYPPSWTQQLGVFSGNEIDEVLVREFIKNIPSKFRKVTIQFNSGNRISGNNIEIRDNYILPLKSSHDELLSNYKYERRRIAKQKKDIAISFESYNRAKEIIELFKESKKNIVNHSVSDYNNLTELINFLVSSNKVEVVSSFDENRKFLGGAFFLLENKRISYLFSSITKEGREKQVMTFMLDAVFKKYANSNIVFDFEGSMISGIAFFFKSFGSQKEKYGVFSKNPFSY